LEETSNLALPYILPSQAQKHVTHNEALRRLDALIQLAVVSRGTGTPPAVPSDGDRYIVGSSATDAWAGKEALVAAWQDGAWAFYEPLPGWVAVILDEDAVCFWDGTVWLKLQGALDDELDGVSIQNAPLAGIGTSADATNIFAAKLNNALWTAKSTGEGGTGNLRYVMNKQASANTLSLLLQSAYSGRAELGLVGNDDFTLKVSADGTSWRDAIVVNKSTGVVKLPCNNILSDYNLNLFADSGRFAGSGVNTVSVSTFAFPAYLSRYNSTTVAGLAKFITNNTDYGGTAGTLNSSAKALVDMIRDASYRRYGAEYWIAELTHGSGTATTTTHLSQTYYLSMFSSQFLRAPNMTFHAYFRAIDDDILVKYSAGQILTLNGTAYQTHVVIQPSAGWVSLTIHDSVPLRQSFGYNPATLNLNCKASGNRYQIACAALMGGITTMDDNVGIVAATNSWPS